MGHHMGHNDHINFELSELLDEAIEAGYLCEEGDRDAIGVARQVIDLGYEGLTRKQKALYDARVQPALNEVSADLKTAAFLNMSNPD